VTTQTVLAHPTAGAFLRVRRHGDWVTIEADWGIGGIGFPDNPASYPPPAEWERRRREVSELVQHATDRCFLLGYRGRRLFFSGSSTGWCVTAPREDELLLLTALLTATAGDFRAAHAYLALPGRRVVASGVSGGE
jgi:hypothetical protein